MRIHILQLLVLQAVACIPLDAQETHAVAAAAKAGFVFGGVGYLHRWSMNDQHEFTPEGQEDLEEWSDMITINIYPNAHDGDALAVKANAVLENYKSHKRHGASDSFRSSDTGSACGAFHRGGLWPVKLY